MSGVVNKTLLDFINQKHDDEAYRFLYAEYHTLLLRFAQGYLKSKEPAEEIVNDVIYKVWMKKEAVAEIQNMRVYLFTAVRNACLTQLSKVKKERDSEADYQFRDFSSDDPESIIITSELSASVRNAINSLPPRCRQIFEMIRIEGIRNKDVAEQLQISVNTIDAQLAIAVKRLVKTVDAFQGKRISKKS